MIDFKCPNCQEGMSVPDSRTGESEACPACGNVAIIPRPTALPLARRLPSAVKGSDSGKWDLMFIYMVFGWVIISCAVLWLHVRIGMAEATGEDLGIDLVIFAILFLGGFLMVGIRALAWRLDDIRRHQRVGESGESGENGE